MPALVVSFLVTHPAFFSRVSAAFCFRVFVSLIVLATTASAATHLVDSLDALQTRLKEAAPGDVITVKNGIYATTDAIAVMCAGTAEKPITLTAETVGGVEIGGTHGFAVGKP